MNSWRYAGRATCTTSSAGRPRHRRRELFLIFARDHVVASEIYRLTEKDLRALEWMPMEDSLSADPA